MKKYLIVLSLLSLVLSCKKANKSSSGGSNIPVQQVQESFASIVTATWCPTCGGGGDSTFEASIAVSPTRINGVALHFSTGDPMYNKDAAALEAFYNAPYYPTYDEGATCDSGYAWIWQAAMAKTLANNNPSCAVGLQKTISDSTMTISTLTHFYSGLPAGQYNLAVYVTENGHVYDQNVSGKDNPNFVHNHIFRANVAGSDFTGAFLANLPSPGLEFSNTFSVKLNSEWNKSNIHVVAVIYSIRKGLPVAVLNSHSI